MRSSKKIIIAATTMALAGMLAVCAACSSQSASSTDNESTDSSDTEAVETDSGEMLTLDEYAEIYPLQTEGWLRLSDDGSKTMGSQEANMTAVMQAAFGLEGLPLYCGCCHNSRYSDLIEEIGDGDGMLMVDADYTGDNLEYMGCGVCHSSDLTAGVSANTQFWPAFISEESWNKYISEDDAICGQCHMLEPSSIYMLPEYSGTVDMYKYGVDADSVLKAMLEAWEENPYDVYAEIEDTATAGAINVGATRIDEATGALIVGDNNKPILETYQGSTHQQMGLTCTDCHMVTMTAEDGTTYTDHYACDPLENETALEFCLTCHTANDGIETTDEMREFVLGKQEALAAAQQAYHAEVLQLQELLTEATANGGVDEDVLEEARWDYTYALFYYQYQAQLTSDNADQGVTASHNSTSTYGTIEEGQAYAEAGIALLS